MVKLQYAFAALAGLVGLAESKDSPRQRAKALLKKMTWEEKVAQMGSIRRLLKLGPEVDEENYESRYELQHGTIGFGPMFNWILDALPIVNDVREKEIKDSRLHIPFITVTDSVNGLFISGGTVFPSNLAMSSTFNLPLFKSVAEAIREEQLSIGVTWVLSPPLDISWEPRYGRIGELFGEDSYLTGEFGHTYVQTMQDKDKNGNIKVACTIKHFVYGESRGGVNAASQYGGINHLFNDQLRPYIRALEADPAAVMVSYASVDLVPMSMNEYMIQEILRGKLGFDGVVMSDAGSISNMYTQSRVATSYADAGLQALKAGLQMELSPGNPAVFPNLIDNVKDKTVAKLIDEAVLNLLTIKFATGLFDNELPDVETSNKTLRQPAHLKLAREADREGIVLLKNDGILPKTPKQVALLGPFGELLNAGSYAAINVSNPKWGDSLHTSLKSALGEKNVKFVPAVDLIDTADDSGIADAVSAAKDAGFAALMLGSLSAPIEDPLFKKRTDGEFFAHADLGLPGLQQQLLDAVLDTGVPTVLILTGGQPFVLNNSTLRSNAILHSLLGGEFTSSALVEIITGEVNPSGKLTISMPQLSSAIPAFYDYLPSDDTGGSEARLGFHSAYQWPVLTKDSPMPFGFGLSYTTFDISTPTAEYKNGNVNIRVTVKNTGDVAGKEVVQVYHRPNTSVGIEFPLRRLVRFEKVDLAAGESKEVKFQIPNKELGYYANAKLKVQEGLYNFWAGSSSRVEDLKGVNVTVTL
ncbi:periplasmic beta-glucosidase [Fusarium albosuccineum]|uniref:beta-glucosidase n=1 Tax=Fusarium albosuccineum TaxID=1237068 RepID=A0A8H4LLR3_9HYPO|nr:periplasmic beta-glucosidase [Fusarium albosuccineum]